MKVSLITVTYNSERTLQDTIDSVLSQSYQNVEYIIVDGASSDNTVDIIKQNVSRFAGRLFWISEKDQGLYDAMNKGIRMATGDVVGILNSDDVFMDDHVLEDVVSQFSPSVDAIFGNLVFVDEFDTDKIVRCWTGTPYRSFQSGWHPAHPTFYVRRIIYDKYGLFDTSFQVSADFELMLRFIERFKIRANYFNRYMVKMRIGGESTGTLKNIIRGNLNVLRAFEKNNLSVSFFYPVKRLLPKLFDRLKCMLGLYQKLDKI